MKVFTLVILLVSVYCMEGAIVKRQEPEPELQQSIQSYLQTVSQFFTEELPKQAKIEELKTQAEAFFQQAHAQLTPLTEQLRERANQFFSTLADTIQKKTS